MNVLNKKLSIKEQDDILSNLFSFCYVNESENEKDHWVLYDDEGYEFFGKNENDKFDFSTLNGIIKYSNFLARHSGYCQAQNDIRKALGISEM